MGRTAESECNVELWRSSDVVPGTIFLGDYFSGPIFPWTIFSADHFFGDHFSEDHFSAYQIYCIETQDSEFAIDGECFWSRKWKEEKNWKSCQMCCHLRKKTSLGESCGDPCIQSSRSPSVSPDSRIGLYAWLSARLSPRIVFLRGHWVYQPLTSNIIHLEGVRDLEGLFPPEYQNLI